MKTKKTRAFLVLLVATVLALISFAAGLSAQGSPVVPEIGFEIEGNAALDQGGDYDWETVVFPPGVLIQDPNSKATTDPSTFRPNSKFDKPGGWSVVPGQVGPGQNELTNILAWGILPGDLGDDRPGEYWLVLGMERTKEEGTFDLDFEFNQEAWDGSSGGPVRTPDDLAVGFELKGNPTDRERDLQVLIIQYLPGAQPSLCSVTPGPGNEPALVERGTDPCPPYGDSGWFYRFLADGAILADSGFGQATMNEEPFPAPEEWSSTDAQGNPRDVIGHFQFAEAAINLTELGIEARCKTYSTVHAKSRSSLEVESDLKDLAGPVPLNVNCRLDGHKFLDVNGNGVWDRPDESPLSGWEIRLNDDEVAYTDEDGYYAFEDLEDGLYTVSEVCPDAWVQSAPGYTDFDTCGTEVHTAELNLYNREVNDLDFGNGRPELGLVKACPADVFVGDDIDYEIEVTNLGNVLLQDILVEDAILGVEETVDLAPGESETFYVTYKQVGTDFGPQRGPYSVFLPLVLRGSGSASAEVQPSPDELTNTATATSQYALATVTASDTCVTTLHELEVTKEALPSFTRIYNWVIDKEVDDAGPITLYPKDFATLQYSVTVDLADPQYVDSEWAVEGTITVDNPAPIQAELESVTDMVSPNIVATVTCPSLIVPPDGSLTCTYGPVQLPNGSDRKNTATVRQMLNNGETRDYPATADVDFGQASIEAKDTEVQVTDIFSGTLEDPLGTVRYDEAPVTFTYERKVEAPGNVCELFEVPNKALFVTNDTGATDSVTQTVQIFELCTATVGYEDLPLFLGNDWDYNDLVVDISPYLDVSPEHDLLSVTFTVIQQTDAGPTADPVLTAFTHKFHLQPDADAIACDGSYTLETTTGGVTIVDTGPYTRGDDFLLVPDTADPPDLIKLRIDFDVPTDTGCPFDFSNFDPVNQYHGEWLFFDPWIFVNNTGEEIRVIKTPGKFEPRLLTVPVDWQWPTPDGNSVWNEYSGVAPATDPTLGPVFEPYWWRTQVSP